MPKEPTTEYDRVSSTEAGVFSLAAAQLALKTSQLFDSAKFRSLLSSKQLAKRLGVTEGRVSQILNGDGNVHIATVARFLRACGYELALTAIPVEPDREPITSERSRVRKSAAINSAAKWQKYEFLTRFGTSEGVTQHVSTVSCLGDEPPIPLEMPTLLPNTVRAGHHHVAFPADNEASRWIQRSSAAVSTEDPKAVKA